LIPPIFCKLARYFWLSPPSSNILLSLANSHLLFYFIPLISLSSHLHVQVWKSYSWDFLNWIVRLFTNKRAGSSFRGKSLLRAALLCLRVSGPKIDWITLPEITPSYPHPQSERPKANDVTEWCLSLLGDREAAVRGLACGVLSCIAAHPRSPASSPSAPLSVSDVLQSVLGIGCDESECYEVRAEALGFVSNFVANFLAHTQNTEMDLVDAVIYNSDSNKNQRPQDTNCNDPTENGKSEHTDGPNGTSSHEAIVHRRILFVLQQANFFTLLSTFLNDTHAAPVFLNSLITLLWLLVCMDSGEVPQSLMREGIWPLIVDLLNLDNYWVKYRHCWTSFWNGTFFSSFSPSQPNVSPRSFSLLFTNT
jgi:hypothetical protein